MTYSTKLCLLLPWLLTGKCPSRDDMYGPTTEALQDYLQPSLQQIFDLAASFRDVAVSPESTLRFEEQLQQSLRELGRRVVQHTYNALEPADARVLPQHVHFEGTTYTRMGRKTPQQAWTLFGQVRLCRAGYRSSRADGSGCLFPLAHSLGLLQGVSPALASQVGRLFAGAGMTQRLIQEQLNRQHGFSWGVKKLRLFMAALAERLKPVQQECLVERVLQLLQQAQDSTGRHKPVLSIGRDGICLGMRCNKAGKGSKNSKTSKKGRFAVASTATLSVYDRRGKRLGTVYLAQAPQVEQKKMNQELTRLVRAVLKAWQGPLPRLCYVTDAGKVETRYYRKVLCVMRHPQTKDRMKWRRVVDYYHASIRVWSMAESLLGKGVAAARWARKMLSWLKLPRGISRVLHSATALRWRGVLKGKAKTAFTKAYRYLRKRMKYMQYAQYKRQGIPLGSGVTEAACKTVYTQRLKLSGMRWNDAVTGCKDGATAQTVLDLRVMLLSGIWERVFDWAVRSMGVVFVLTNEPSSSETHAFVA